MRIVDLTPIKDFEPSIYDPQATAEAARRFWEAAEPITGTLGERYLRARAITAALPETLRFTQQHWYASGINLPAIIARVEGSPGFAIHRTFLDPTTAGKAKVDAPKKMLGPANGGAVRLRQGAGPLVVCEGLETALSIPSLLPGDPTIWAALSSSGLTSLRLPEIPADLLVIADGDSAGRGAAQALATRALGLGWKVSIIDCGDKLDANDLLQKGAALPQAERVGWAEPAESFITEAFPTPNSMDPSPLRGSKGAPMPTEITARELQTRVFPPIAWVVPDLIPDGLSMVAGKPKIGKSWLALDVAVAVARGSFVLDKKCIDGGVLYAALEDNGRRLQARMRRVCPIADWPCGLTFWTEMEKLEEGGLDQLQQWISTAEKPRLIIIDVFTKVRRQRGDREGIYDADYQAVAPLKQLADETGVAIVVVHHLRKMAADNDPFDAVSGSTGLTGAMDSILILDRGSGGTTLYARGRDLEEQDLAVRFDKTSCRWSLLGDASEVRMSDERRAILGALRGEDEPLSPLEIAALTGQPSGNIRRLLLSMAKDGEVTKIKRGKYVAQDAGNIGNKVTSDED